MRLRNNPKSQTIADCQAKKDECFFFADYIGIYDGKLVYLACHEDSRVRFEGFPNLIFVDAEGNVSESIGLESLEIINEIHHRDYRRGREMFRRFKRLLADGEVTPFERRYWNEVVTIVECIEDYIPLDRTTVFRFLEAADRLGFRLELCMEQENMYGTERPCYYVSLVQRNEFTEEECV